MGDLMQKKKNHVVHNLTSELRHSAARILDFKSISSIGADVSLVAQSPIILPNLKRKGIKDVEQKEKKEFIPHTNVISDPPIDQKYITKEKPLLFNIYADKKVE